MNGTKIIALLLALLLLSGCAAGEAPVSPTEPETTETEPAAPTEPSETVPASQPEETEETEDPQPATALHSGLREDGSFDEGTLLIGDSLTYGFVLQYLTREGYLGDARYMAIVGAPVRNFFSLQTLRASEDYSCVYTPAFQGLNFADSVTLAGESVTAVYYMMGTNYDPEVTPETYVEILDHILTQCPQATVYLQLVPMSTMSYIPYETINEIITKAYDHYAASGETRVQLIDTHTAIGDRLNDGIHLTLEGQAGWYSAIVDYAKENSIPE